MTYESDREWPSGLDGYITHRAHTDAPGSVFVALYRALVSFGWPEYNVPRRNEPSWPAIALMLVQSIRELEMTDAEAQKAVQVYDSPEQLRSIAKFTERKPLAHHRAGVDPIWLKRYDPEEHVWTGEYEWPQCPECLKAVHVDMINNEWACPDPKCRYA